MTKIIELKHVKKSFGLEGSNITILKQENLIINQGEFVIIMGPSGSGKSTLLSLIGGLDSADNGSIKVNSQELTGMNANALRSFRKKNIGFIFQFNSC